MMPILAVVITLVYVGFMIWVTISFPWLVLICAGWLYILVLNAKPDYELWPDLYPPPERAEK